MTLRPYDPVSTAGRLLGVAERLYDAIATRDVVLVRALLDSQSASLIPRDVREEALTVVALPATSMRAPMALLQFHRRLGEVARDVPAEEAQQMELRLVGRTVEVGDRRAS